MVIEHVYIFVQKLTFYMHIEQIASTLQVVDAIILPVDVHSIMHIYLFFFCSFFLCISFSCIFFQELCYLLPFF